MKYVLFFLLLISATAAEVGRYQLYTSPLIVEQVRGQDVYKPTLFRIDTVTGQTWVYLRVMQISPSPKTLGTFSEGWVLMSEDYLASSYLATLQTHGKAAAEKHFEQIYGGDTNRLSDALGRMTLAPQHRATP